MTFIESINDLFNCYITINIQHNILQHTLSDKAFLLFALDILVFPLLWFILWEAFIGEDLEVLAEGGGDGRSLGLVTLLLDGEIGLGSLLKRNKN